MIYYNAIITLDTSFQCDKLILQSNQMKLQKEDAYMADIKNIKLTDDPLTNIQMMIPFLNDKSREALSYVIYGCCIGEEMAKKDSKEKEE